MAPSSTAPLFSFAPSLPTFNAACLRLCSTFLFHLSFLPSCMPAPVLPLLLSVRLKPLRVLRPRPGNSPVGTGLALSACGSSRTPSPPAGSSRRRACACRRGARGAHATRPPGSGTRPKNSPRDAAYRKSARPVTDTKPR
eukprot:6191812-Pleurochrysis_carterae.AAC.1